MAADKTNYDIHDTVSLYNEHRRHVDRLEKVFQQMIGIRTLRLIRQIGIAETKTIRSDKRLTVSDGLQFQLPNYDNAHTLSFAIEQQGLLSSVGIGRVISASARLRTEGRMITKYHVGRWMFTHRTAIAGNDTFPGRTGTFDREVDAYMNLVRVGESLRAGSSIESFMDYIPAGLPNIDSFASGLSPDSQGQWSILQLPLGSRVDDTDDEA